MAKFQELVDEGVTRHLSGRSNVFSTTTQGRRKNYDLFSGCAWYTPGVAGVFAVLGWFLAGMILGSLINIGLMIFLPGFPLYYSMLIVYPVQFIPVLMYVRLRSMRNSTLDERRLVGQQSFRSLGRSAHGHPYGFRHNSPGLDA